MSDRSTTEATGIIRRRPIIARSRRMTLPLSQLSCASYHEAGHGVATLLGFRTVRSPMPAPPIPVELIEIYTPEKPHPYLRAEGKNYGISTYAPEWPAERRIAPEWREAMEWHIVIMLAGGIAEAIARGERRKRQVLPFAIAHCGCRTDRVQVAKTLDDLHVLTGRRYSEQRFADRTRALLLAYWPAVRALAEALIEAKRLEGEQIEEIVKPYLSSSNGG
jgi:hypothetical protein